MSLSSLVVYHYPLSRSVRVVWLLNELDVEFETKHIKLFQGESFTKEFLQMNPNHAVPVLQYRTPENETKTIIESAAIIRFLVSVADKLPRKASSSSSASRAVSISSLVPTPATHSIEQVAEFEQWFAFCAVSLDSTLWMIRVLNDFRNQRPEEREALQVFIDKWNNVQLPQLNKRFEEKPDRQYAMDWGFSLVDILLGQLLPWSKKYSSFLKPFGPKLREYEKRLRSRPALTASLKDAHLFEKDAKL